MFEIKENSEQERLVCYSDARRVETIIASNMRNAKESFIWFRNEYTYPDLSSCLIKLIYRRPQTPKQIYESIKAHITGEFPSNLEIAEQIEWVVGTLTVSPAANEQTKITLHTYKFVDCDEAVAYLTQLCAILDKLNDPDA